MESSDYDNAKISMEKAAPITSQGQGLQYPLASREPEDSNIVIVHHAIEAIGMGKYQWQLLTTCGFGFLTRYTLISRLAKKKISKHYG